MCPSVSECVRVCPSVSECARVCPSVSECVRVCPSVPECARVYPSVSEFPRISLRMCECAELYGNIGVGLYAHVFVDARACVYEHIPTFLVILYIIKHV